MKDFQPYSNLWLNTRTWFVRHKAWTEGAWDEIDPVELETTFENVMKAMGTVVRYFKDKGFPKILQNAADMKAKIDEFKPIVPIALSLRKKVWSIDIGIKFLKLSDSTSDQMKTSPLPPVSRKVSFPTPSFVKT